MSIETLRARLPESLKDVRLNLSALANEETLSEQAKWGLLLACAIASRNAEVRDAFAAEAAGRLSEAAAGGARRGRRDGDEQRLLSRRASRLQQGIREDAGAVANERHRQSWRRRRPTSSCGAWRCRRSTVAAPASTRTRKRCSRRASRPSRSTRPCATRRSSSRRRSRSKRRGRRTSTPPEALEPRRRETSRRAATRAS